MGEIELRAARAMPFLDDEAVCEQVADHCLELSTLHGCLPTPEQRLPDEGGWIVLREQPYTEIPSPPFASMWRARPVFAARTFRGILAGGRRRTLKWPEERARIVTPAGELTLLMTEYAVVRDLRPYLDAEGAGVTLHVMGPGAVEDDLRERVFYLQCRGLKRADALTLLLPEVTDQTFAWLSMDGISDVETYEAALDAHRPRAVA